MRTNGRIPYLEIPVRSLALGLVLVLAPQALCDDDYYLSVPALGAIMRVDNGTAQPTTFASGVVIPHYGWFIDGDLIMPDRYWPAVHRIKPDGTIIPLSAGGMFVRPVTAIPAPAGDGILLSDSHAPAIFHVAWDGTQTLLYGPANTNGLLTGPDGLAFDRAGNLYAANLVGDTIVKIDPAGNATLFSDSPLISEPGGIAIDGSGNLFVAMYGNSKLVRFRLDTGAAELFAEDADLMNKPSDLKLSRSGGLMASTRNSNVVRIHSTGAIEVLFHGEGYGDIVGVSVPEDSAVCTGSFTPYGVGKAGSGGIVPELRAIFSPCPSHEHAFELSRFVGGTTGYLFVGLGPASVPLLGGTLLVDISGFNIILPLPIGGSGAGNGYLRLPFVVPNIPGIVGANFYHQVIAADPGAPKGVSMSNALHEVIGN